MRSTVTASSLPRWLWHVVRAADSRARDRVRLRSSEVRVRRCGWPVFPALLVGHTLLVLPYVVRVIGASLASFDFSIEEAAISLGSPPLKTFFTDRVLPNIRAGVIAAFILAFITSLNNVSISLFLTGPGVSTLPIQMLAHVEQFFDPTVASVSVLLMLLTVARDGGSRAHARTSHFFKVVSVTQPLLSSRCQRPLRRDKSSRRPLAVHSARANSSRCSAPAAAARRRRCGWSPGSCTPTAARSSSAGATSRGLPSHKRDIGLVFQNYALFPHLSVRDNVGFRPEAAGPCRVDERNRRAHAMLERVGLAGFGRSDCPRALSGGQKQRVALARALVIDPPLLMFDEPLSNLDAKLRVDMRVEIRSAPARQRHDVVYVTHDQEEAFSISDRVAIMNAGRIMQFDAPEVLYRRPDNAFVARFVGFENILPMRVVRKRRRRCVMAENSGRCASTSRKRTSAPSRIALSSPTRPDGLSCRRICRRTAYRRSWVCGPISAVPISINARRPPAG